MHGWWSAPPKQQNSKPRKAHLWRDALSPISVVIHARLVVRFGEDGGPLAKSDEAPRPQLQELPPHKGVVVAVVVGGDERPARENIGWGGGGGKSSVG
eukprot:scaffold18707_cov124-Isochrysis_galbana.AAC.1